MCGVTGIWNFNRKGPASKEMEDFNNTLSHRGPDGGHIYLDNKTGLGLGHRRLAILDLTEQGNQPMSYLNQRYWIVFNGEIFNFIELRKELVSLGYSFKSDTDTEVILASYHEWHEKCLDKFNGMWAFAIWDNEEEKLFISRDRFGVKPLYYTFAPNHQFAFASETIAFKNLMGFKREVDPKILERALVNPFCFEGFGYTLYRHIYQLLPGHYAYIKIDDKELVQKRWWSTLKNSHLDIPPSYDMRVQKFREIFEDSCRIRMRSDVPIATALSGGLDSSSVYCTLNGLMTKQKEIERVPQDWQRAFVGVFKNTSLDEKTYADEVIKYTNGKVVYIEQDFSSLEEEIISSTCLFDNLYVSPISVVANIYRSMRENGVIVSLDGHGVDEMLFGYRSLTSEVSASPIKKIKAIIKNFIGWNKDFEYLGEKEDLSKLSYLDRIVYRTFHLTTLPTILRNFDRASMQNGIEIRMPFMDPRLVSFVFSLPLNDKVDSDFNKKILRDSMKGKMPESIRTRKSKIGLNAPMTEWFAGPLKSFIEKKVNSDIFQRVAGKRFQNLKKMVEMNMRTNNWSWQDCATIWPYINAVILIENN